jgi:20S proteasome alpha/beta subunit
VTLLVALRGSDGLVLAADSRGTFGDPRSVTAQNDAMKKAHVLSRRVALLQAGAGEVGALIVQEVAPQLSNDADVNTALQVLRDHVRRRYGEWFPSVAAVPAPTLAQTGQVPTRPDLIYLVAGFEPDTDVPGETKIFQIMSANDFSPMLHDYGFAVAGVAQYALYLLNRFFEPKRSVAELLPLAVYAITETASQDGKVGGPVNVITIRAEQGCEALTPAAVELIVSENSERSAALRSSFYGTEGES